MSSKLLPDHFRRVAEMTRIIMVDTVKARLNGDTREKFLGRVAKEIRHDGENEASALATVDAAAECWDSLDVLAEQFAKRRAA
jgi:hypothetical protein